MSHCDTHIIGDLEVILLTIRTGLCKFETKHFFTYTKPVGTSKLESSISFLGMESCKLMLHAICQLAIKVACKSNCTRSRVLVFIVLSTACLRASSRESCMSSPTLLRMLHKGACVRQSLASFVSSKGTVNCN